MSRIPKTVAMLGAGSWGTAVAMHLAQAGNRVRLWGHNPEHVRSMQEARCNIRFLPDIRFPETLVPVMHLEEALRDTDIVFIAVPSHAFGNLLARLPDTLPNMVWLTKGLDPASHCFLSELVSQRFGDAFPSAILSGPSFAREVAAGLPTAVTLAGNTMAFLEGLRAILHYQHFRVYLSRDFTGVQWCGAMKNVIAIACGLSDGLGFGANARAALITRGLAEMQRLGLVLGAQPETFPGLAGVGDLVLTCTDNQSRNRRFGLALGQGASVQEALSAIHQVVEGRQNAAQVCLLAESHGIELPVCQQINYVLAGHISPQQAAENLLARPPAAE